MLNYEEKIDYGKDHRSLYYALEHNSIAQEQLGVAKLFFQPDPKDFKQLAKSIDIMSRSILYRTRQEGNILTLFKKNYTVIQKEYIEDTSGIFIYEDTYIEDLQLGILGLEPKSISFINCLTLEKGNVYLFFYVNNQFMILNLTPKIETSKKNGATTNRIKIMDDKLVLDNEASFIDRGLVDIYQTENSSVRRLVTAEINIHNKKEILFDPSDDLNGFYGVVSYQYL